MIGRFNMTENMIQKGFVVSIALLFFGTGAIGPLNGNLTDHLSHRGNTLYVGGSGSGNYTHIQDAIDNASNGDTIIVYAKTYHENQITIGKALTIKGAGWPTTIIDGSNATLTSCGLVRIIANGNVIFQGFTVRNAGGPTNGGDGNDGLTNVGIYAQSASSGATFYISNNKIFGTNEPDDYEDYGFYAYSGLEHSIFTNNVVTQTGANALLIEKHIGSTEISYNTLDAGCWGIDPIYCMTYAGTDITTLQKISYNIIDVGTGVNPHGPSDNKITGLGFSSAYLGCTGTPDSGKYTNIEISNNTINNVQAYERGIALDNFAGGNGSEGEISNAVIKGNIINGVSTNQTSFGIRLSGLVSNTIIQENQITNCDMSFWGRTGYYGSSTGYPTGTLIKYNNFEDNGRGLVWEGATILNATDNWWGNASGPCHSGNPGGTGDPISGNVDYTPWLLYPYGPDVTPPLVVITCPQKGFLYINIADIIVIKIPFLTTVIVGNIEVTANATDNQSGINRVEFYLDNELQATDTTAPYNWTWSERGFFFPYILTVVAYDNAENHNSAEVKVWKIF